MMNSMDWYYGYFEINDYKVGNLPEFLFLTFPHRVSRRDCRRIARYNRKLGFQTTKFYKQGTIMVAYKFNN